MALNLNQFQAALQTKLEDLFKSDQSKNSLKKTLDGGELQDTSIGSKNINEAIEGIVDDQVSELNEDSSPEDWRSTMRKINSNQLGSGISNSVCQWLSDEIAPLLSSIISTEVDSYIRSANITIPAGQQVTVFTKDGSFNGQTSETSNSANIS